MGQPEDLTDAERAELQRLRLTATRSRRWGRRGRWAGATVLLFLAAVVGTLAVAATYVRSEVLNTETYVATVAPLADEPAVRDAVSARLAQEIVTRTDLSGLATDLANQLEKRGAPTQLSDLTAPLVSGLTSFLQQQINDLLATEQFRDLWETINREAHQGLVTVLTGEGGQVIKSSGDTVTLDLGALLTEVKQRLVANGFTLASRVPEVSLSYTLLQSDQLPKLRTYTRILNTGALWMPWLALALFVGGIFAAPQRRRAMITGVVMIAVLSIAALGLFAAVRTYYLDHASAAAGSPEAVTEIYDTVLRFLVTSLQTLLAAALIALVGGLLAGSNRPARAVRRLGNRWLDAGGRLLSRTGMWAAATARVLNPFRLPVRVVAIAVVGLVMILLSLPTVGALLWATVVALLVVGIVEVLARSPQPE